MVKKQNKTKILKQYKLIDGVPNDKSYHLTSRLPTHWQPLFISPVYGVLCVLEMVCAETCLFLPPFPSVS